jgi:hypothetical protein
MEYDRSAYVGDVRLRVKKSLKLILNGFDFLDFDEKRILSSFIEQNARDYMLPYTNYFYGNWCTEGVARETKKTKFPYFEIRCPDEHLKFLLNHILITIELIDVKFLKSLSEFILSREESYLRRYAQYIDKSCNY